jgi:hypothetical protein
VFIYLVCVLYYLYLIVFLRAIRVIRGPFRKFAP